MPTKTSFCANCQAEKPHAIEVNVNGEIVLTCECSRFIKFPPGLDAPSIDSLLATHKTANEGQVSIQASHDAAAALADKPAEEQPPA